MEYNRDMEDCNCKRNRCVIRKMDESPCPHLCIIPIVEVETADGIKSLAGCYVHVLSTNTTYYKDDRGRIITTWSGDLYIDDYDYQNNPLNLRAKTVYDIKNSRQITYGTSGDYMIIAGE